MYQVEIDGFESQQIEFKPAGLFSTGQLLVDGEPVKKGEKRGEMLLLRDDGSESVATWKPTVLGFDIPKLVIDDQIIDIVEPLKWYEIAWVGLPILLIFVGGLVGGVSGGVAFAINSKLFRGEGSTAVKYLMTGGVSALAIVGYIFGAAILTMLIG